MQIQPRNQFREELMTMFHIYSSWLSELIAMFHTYSSKLTELFHGIFIIIKKNLWKTRNN